jgi:hypothetical protein
MGGRRLVWAILFAWALPSITGSVRADEREVKIIPLRHRPAAELVELLTPLVGPGGALSALDTRLVVRATPEALARIERALLELDVPLRSLLITVSQEVARAHSREGAGVEGVGAQSGRSSDDVTQQIRALEGYPALIRIGRAEPLRTTAILPGPGGPAVISGTAFAGAGTGFYVRPRLGGNFVTLELWAENTRGVGPVVEGHDLRTTVSGRMGEWIVVESALHQAEIRVRELFGTESRTLIEERAVRVRVDEVR